MAGVNKVILVGNLGKDPEVRHLESGSVVANLTLATTEAYKDKNGQRVENTEWHDLELWDGQAKIAEQYLKKGSQIYVEGRLQTRKWQTKEGQDRYTTEIVADTMQMLGSKDSSSDSSTRSSNQEFNQEPSKASQSKAPSPATGSLTDFEDDIPF